MIKELLRHAFELISVFAAVLLICISFLFSWMQIENFINHGEEFSIPEWLGTVCIVIDIEIIIACAVYAFS